MRGRSEGDTINVVDVDQFWSLIESARRDAGDRLHAEFEDRFLTGLEARMDALPLDEPIEYDARRIELYERADVPGLRAVNRMVDSTVEYLPEPSPAFLSGLVSLGRETFERALDDADSLLWDPLIRVIAASQVGPDRMLLGEMAAMAGYNYEYRLDAVVNFPALVDAAVSRDEAGSDDGAASQEDEDDEDDEYDEDDEDDGLAGGNDGGCIDEDSWDEVPAEVRRRLPRLSAVFAARMETAEQTRRRRRRWSTIGWAALFAAIMAVVIVVAVRNTAW